MRKTWAQALLATILVGGAGAGVWLWLRWPASWTVILQLNNRGVAWMEQYNYPEAEKVFREEVAQSRGWVPARINLAIALLNQNKPVKLAESIEILRSVLAKESENPHAHYCLALSLSQEPDGLPEAAEHFAAVTRIDPADAHAWYQLGKCREIDAPETADECFRKAVELDPYLAAAIYNMGLRENRSGRLEQGKKLLKLKQELADALWESTADIPYGTQGRYAEVIGGTTKPTTARPAPLPRFETVEQFQVQLSDSTRWATDDDFRGDPIRELRGRVRERFGVTSATLDYNDDGKIDVLLLGSVVRDGTLGDLLLRNDGDWRFTDVTLEAGLAGARASLGCAVGDLDNDGRPDLFFTCAGANRLFRNTGGGFEDVTDQAGIADASMISLGAACVDLDQDGDLDIYVTHYTSLDHASVAFTTDPSPAVPNTVLQNVGKARPVTASAADDTGGASLEIAFRAVAEPAELVAGEHSVGLALADFDSDRDIDLFLIQDGRPAELVSNDRLMRFSRQPVSADVLPPGRYNGAVAADFDKDGRTDVWVISPDGRAVLLLNQGKVDGAVRFAAGVTNAEKMLQGRVVDLDLDGWFDIVGLAGGKAVFVRNQSDRLAVVPDTLSAATPGEAPAAVADEGAGKVVQVPVVRVAARPLAALASDLDGDGPADLLAVAPAAHGAKAVRNLGNGNHWVKLRLTGTRNTGKKMRTNRDAVAARFTVHAADLWVQAEQGSTSAGLGSCYEPVLIGLGRRSSVDCVRVRWPDGVLQAELERPADQLIAVGQVQRQEISCPLLFTWNGRRFEYVADFLGGGGLGYLLEPGVYNLPDRDEAVKIEPGQLVANDGRFVLKIAEPMDEVTYLDRATLVVIDHPAELSVFPDERFALPESRPQWKLYAYQSPIFAARATDSGGHDVTAKLRDWDRDAVDDFKLLGAWVGYAEYHDVVLDFADRLAGFGPRDPLVLYLAGWVEFPFSQTNFAAATAGVHLQPPMIERLDEDGRWQPLFPCAGHPSGSAKMMTLDVTGKLCGPRCVLRIRTNMQVYWDQIFVAPAEDLARVHVRELEVVDASVGYRGHLQEYSPDGRGPTLHEYQRVDAVPLVHQSGRYTRYGDVRELLAGDDDRFVIFGAGDELTVEFDATGLPHLPTGWRRSFVLRTWGYSKSADVLTAHADTVEPLPFRGMSGYPFSLNERPSDPAGHEAYQRAFNTRVVDP